MSEPERTFNCNDKVVGKMDGEPMRAGYITAIDMDAPWPYVVRDIETDLYGVFTADELEIWDGT